MCNSLGAPLPNMLGVSSGSHPSQSRRWFESEIRHLLDGGLHSRATLDIASLFVVHFPSSAVSVGGGPAQIQQPTGGASLDHARQGHDRCPGGRTARHLQLLVECSVGHLAHCFQSAHGSRTFEWSGSSDVAFQSKTASEWWQHPWTFYTASPFNSPGSLRTHVRFVGAGDSQMLFRDVSVFSILPISLFSPLSACSQPVFQLVAAVCSVGVRVRLNW